jgi:hypothetical protein
MYHRSSSCLKVFFVWGSTCTACALFAYFFVPETKGLSLEQVDRMMEECTSRQSSKWVSHTTYASNLGMEKDGFGGLSLEYGKFDRVDVASSLDEIAVYNMKGTSQVSRCSYTTMI